MKVFNTLTNRLEEFEPLNDKKVGIYACGVTVYDLCHIGHARSAVVFDVIVRYLRYRGFDVKFVRNFTDIDDKIINRANKEGVTWNEIAERYTEEYYKDMDRLGIARADIEPKATDHIAEMIKIVKALIERGYAYTVDEGEAQSVYFSVEKFPQYGKLSKKKIDELMSGARVDVNERKRSPLDFALWKASKPGEPWWESPWGKGRPGWHIECSAMSLKHIGETLDIHGGGADLIFPHHENEIAQSEAYTGKPFAKYWIHNGFVTIDKEKMSKSLGNVLNIRDLLDIYDAEALRLFLLSSHYRSPIEFAHEYIKEAEATLDRVYSTIWRIEDFEKVEPKDKSKSNIQIELNIENLKSEFEKAMDDDFNTAKALGVIFEFIKELNRFMDKKPSNKEELSLLSYAKKTINELGGVLNLFQREPIQWYRDLLKIKKVEISEEEINRLIEERVMARKNKDWQKADTIRQELLSKGIILEDKPDRTVWKIKI
ncbi:MAG: cysteine--tRNA ligase [Thermodesulfovibrio sp.]|jgi:cysteinyl-tRNA synthetase|uniref:cysteine--tRNA ligase n=1 Tax=unclassified Thermodesulfovibrio TaxID=2645936 RepID=UPI00083B63AA|nr:MULTISPECIES: cysteine--tRNA ligase [unclassified Thermodesulfovibrio]MDI1471778.1 cysteine--tRNA ligase [Thermodesulfovibrio sp. 1176]MDI6713668.1 cysteine--tRNA ligase [Thermodesulfovibrio sp.]ODA44169.1 Cysteinyl-tRNA synthetase [Thermodesulfovibrio sp. N1]